MGEGNMYELRAIANYFIERGIRERVEISPMKLQKLLFYAYGLYWSKKGQPLFSDRFEVWKYGPVISELYHTLKSYGNSSIDRPILDLDLKTMQFIHPSIDRTDKRLLKFLDGFWLEFKDYSAFKLSNATHAENTPWKLALNRGEQVINDEEMKTYFEREFD